MATIVNETISARELHGVRALTTFGWKYIGSYRSKEAAEAVADEARESKRYLKVKID